MTNLDLVLRSDDSRESFACGSNDGDTSILPLRLENLCFRAGARGRLLIDTVSLEFRANTRTIILGPNGAGKSLLLRLCHGLLIPSAGRVCWSHSDRHLLRRAQAMVFQRPVLLRRSVGANIDYALSLRGIPRRERRALIMRALEQVGLAHLEKRPARVLSGGEQQRLVLARAWALQPQVLFLDEPTANLDPGATRLIEGIIDAIHRAGSKIVMTTHDLGQARRHADDVVFMHRGRLLEHTPAAAFFRRPASQPAHAFLAGELLH
jgi:tungstate transport system ATP-binding protein